MWGSKSAENCCPDFTCQYIFLPFPSRSGDPSVGRDAGSKLWAWNDVLHKPPVPASQFLGEKHSARKREPSPAKPMPKIRLYHKSTFWKIERLIKRVFLLLLCVMVNFMVWKVQFCFYWSLKKDDIFWRYSFNFEWLWSGCKRIHSTKIKKIELSFIFSLRALFRCFTIQANRTLSSSVTKS